MRTTKTEQLVGLMRAGDWPRALSLANTFRMLGQHRDTIRLAHECRVWPAFYRGVGRDPDAAVAAGIAALQQLYPTPYQREDSAMNTTRHGHRQVKRRTFTMAQVEEASGLQAGYCLACGEMQECCEPDAREYRCDNCKQSQVFGAEELLIMGLVTA